MSHSMPHCTPKFPGETSEKIFTQSRKEKPQRPLRSTECNLFQYKEPAVPANGRLFSFFGPKFVLNFEGKKLKFYDSAFFALSCNVGGT